MEVSLVLRLNPKHFFCVFHVSLFNGDADSVVWDRIYNRLIKARGVMVGWLGAC